MSRYPSDIRPATRALDRLIRRTISQVLRTANDQAADAMLFLGNWHQAFPALLVQDPILEPVDKVVWMVVCQQGRAAGSSTAFPRYSEIALQANIASTSTVSRAIAVLRATRWLSVCARVRDGNGRFRGNVYALHDEPLPFADAMHLDPDYMTFIQSARQHHHRRVRKVAEAILHSIDEDIAAGVDLLAPVSMAERRLEAAHAVRQEGSRRYFSFSAAVLSRLTNRTSASRAADQDQISKSVGCSSSYIKTTTTTTKNEKLKKIAREANDVPVMAALVYPRRLDDNQCEVAARYLAVVPPDQRQSVLDELEGRIRAEQQGARPVYDELRYLHQLCTQVNAGGFQPNLSLKVQGERARRAQAAEKRGQQSRAEQASHRDVSRQTRSAFGKNSLTEARKILGRTPVKNPETSDL